MLTKVSKSLLLPSLGPPLSLTSGSIEVLKWFALICMTIDHINNFLIFKKSYLAFCIGRIAMPIFTFVLAYNIAQMPSLTFKNYFKIIKRLIFFGILATPAFTLLKSHGVLAKLNLLPLNILWSFALWISILYLLQHKKFFYYILSVCLIIILGPCVEYRWQGFLFFISAVLVSKENSPLNILFCIFCCHILKMLNGNDWALISLMLVCLFRKINFKIPRIPYFFYTYYVMHLTLILIVNSIAYT